MIPSGPSAPLGEHASCLCERLITTFSFFKISLSILWVVDDNCLSLYLQLYFLGFCWKSGAFKLRMLFIMIQTRLYPVCVWHAWCSMSSGYCSFHLPFTHLTWLADTFAGEHRCTEMLFTDQHVATAWASSLLFSLSGTELPAWHRMIQDKLSW